MDGTQPVTYGPFTVDLADELVAMWRASFERAVGVIRIPSPNNGPEWRLADLRYHWEAPEA